MHLFIRRSILLHQGEIALYWPLAEIVIIAHSRNAGCHEFLHTRTQLKYWDALLWCEGEVGLVQLCFGHNATGIEFHRWSKKILLVLWCTAATSLLLLLLLCYILQYLLYLCNSPQQTHAKGKKKKNPKPRFLCDTHMSECVCVHVPTCQSWNSHSC